MVSNESNRFARGNTGDGIGLTLNDIRKAAGGGWNRPAPGRYLFEVEEAELTTSKAGNEAIRFRLCLFDRLRQPQGTILLTQIWHTDLGAQTCMRLVEATGIDQKLMPDETVSARHFMRTRFVADLEWNHRTNASFPVLRNIAAVDAWGSDDEQ